MLKTFLYLQLRYDNIPKFQDRQTEGRCQSKPISPRGHRATINDGNPAQSPARIMEIYPSILHEIF